MASPFLALWHYGSTVSRARQRLQGVYVAALVVFLMAQSADGRGVRTSSTPIPTEDTGAMEKTLEAYAKSVVPFKTLALVTSFFGFLALVHKNLLRLFETQTKWTTGVYIVLVAVFCWSLLSSVWTVVWPLSGAELLLTGHLADEKAACGALVLFGPIRLLNTLLTCVLVLFAPVVLIPPKQKGMVEADNLPQWCVHLLVRMYAVVLVAQLGNCYYVYEFFEFNLAAMAALQRSAQHELEMLFDEGVHGRLGLMFNTSSLAASFSGHDAASDLTPISALALYVVIIWCALMVTYERLARRSFKEDFPRNFFLMVLPGLKRFETCAGRIAKYYNQGQQDVVALAEKLEAAKATVVAAPSMLARANGTVRVALQETKEGIITLAGEHRRKGYSDPDEAVNTLRDLLLKEVDAHLLAFLKFTDSERRFFERLWELISEGVDGGRGVRPVPREPSPAGDGPEVPVSGFEQSVLKSVHEAIDRSCDTVLRMHVMAADAAVGKVTGLLCAELDKMSFAITRKLEALEEDAKILTEKVQSLLKQIKDFIDPKVALAEGLFCDQLVLTKEADQLVKVVSTLPFTCHRVYPAVYAVLFVCLTLIALAFEVMAFSMILVFWNKWSHWAQASIAGMLMLFGVLIAFNSVFFHEALSGRLGHVADRGDLALSTSIDEAAGDAELGTFRELPTEEPQEADTTALLGDPLPVEDIADQAVPPRPLKCLREGCKAWLLVVFTPAISLVFIALGAFALSESAGATWRICMKQ